MVLRDGRERVHADTGGEYIHRHIVQSCLKFHPCAMLSLQFLRIRGRNTRIRDKNSRVSVKDPVYHRIRYHSTFFLSIPKVTN